MVLSILGFVIDVIFLLISQFVDTDKIHLPRKKLLRILAVIAILFLILIIFFSLNSNDEINNTEPTIIVSSAIPTESTIPIPSSEEINLSESTESTTDLTLRRLSVSVKCSNDPEYNDYYVTVEPPQGVAYHFSPTELPCSIAFQEGTYVISVTDKTTKDVLYRNAILVADGNEEINVIFELPSPPQEDTSIIDEMTTFYLEAICDSKEHYNDFKVYVYLPNGELYNEYDAQEDSQPWMINGPQGVYRCSIENNVSGKIVKDETVVNTIEQASTIHTIHFNVLAIEWGGTSYFEEANLVVRIISSDTYRYDDIIVMIESEYGETYTFATLDTEELWLTVHSGETYYFHIKESDAEDADDICPPLGIYVNSPAEREDSNYDELDIQLP